MPYYNCPTCKKPTLHIEHFLNALDLYQGKRKMQCTICKEFRIISIFEEKEQSL